MTSELRRRLGIACWVAQPLLIGLELVAAATSRAPYSFVDNTISDLGATTCTTIPYPTADVPVCSPAHALLNGGLVVGGLLLALGAILLAPAYARSRAGRIACVLWVVCGASSLVTGLVPLDVDLELHALVSTPGILLQPVALGLHAWAYARERGPSAWWALVALGVLTLLIAVVFLMRLDTAYGGLAERAAIWPVLLALPALALGRRAGADR